MLSRKHYCCFWYILYGTWKEKCQLNNVPIPVILDFDIKRTLGCPRFVWNFLSHLLVNNKGDNIISFAFQLTWNTCSTINENDVREEMRCAVTSKDGPLIRMLMHFSYKEEIYKLLLFQYYLKRQYIRKLAGDGKDCQSEIDSMWLINYSWLSSGYKVLLCLFSKTCFKKPGNKDHLSMKTPIYASFQQLIWTNSTCAMRPD